jgi:hypothetical protein
MAFYIFSVETVVSVVLRTSRFSLSLVSLFRSRVLGSLLRPMAGSFSASFNVPVARLTPIALAMTLIGFGMGGCGFGIRAQREPWREEAEQACLARKEVKPSIHIVRGDPIEGSGTCGISSPLKVSAFDQGDLTLNGKATLGCPMVSKTQVWLQEVVQPAARLIYGMNVIHMRVGSYACRSRNNQRGAKLSEHSFGNALDVMSFKLADGRDVTVVKGWRGSSQDQDFLREVFVGACTHFNTVLGPGSDMFHYDHFHLDLARHDPRGVRRVCRPIIKYAPQLNAGSSSAKQGAQQSPNPVYKSPIYKGAVSTPLLSTPLLSSSPLADDAGDEEGVEDPQTQGLSSSLRMAPSQASGAHNASSASSLNSPVVLSAPLPTPSQMTSSLTPSLSAPSMPTGLRPPQPLSSSGAGLY